jgi:phosphoglycerate kinase
MKTIDKITFTNKRVVVRVDFNVPMEGDTIQDTTRMKETLPTLQKILSQKPKYLLIISHQGRPEGKRDSKLSLGAHAKKLSELLKENVTLVTDVLGEKLPQEKGIMMLENIRFFDEETKDEKKRKEFAQHLAQFADVYINDAFACSHRAHASMYDLPKMVEEKAMGLLLEKEMNALSPLLKNPKKPVVLVLGGAKIDTKIGIIKNFKDIADTILVGGAMATTFLSAMGYEIGKSLCEKDKIEVAQEILLSMKDQKERFIIPRDVIIADEMKDDAITADLPIRDIDYTESIFDIGSKTTELFVQKIKEAKTIIWNGPVGVYEHKPFQNGTKKIAEAIASSKATTIIGGGDTIDAINRFGIPMDKFTHVSTGGGAMLEFLEGKKLPGIAALE